ncbi:nucleolysin TIAR-like [Sycon ciliatum]|uniref:nucleolysin TIAR-like n=1 Tax=Sycon ciliatum TaxID=27933 RepID=UPI0031F6CAC6
MSAAMQPEDREEEKACVLYVGNLDRRANEETVKEIFNVVGTIRRCNLISEHQGTDPYCFVEFDNHETALDALTKMNGKKLFSKCIRVSWATTQGAAKKDTSGHYHVFVGDLSPDVNADMLRTSFSEFGEVTDSRVVCDASNGKSRGFGFVSFPTKQEAQAAIDRMNGQVIGQRPVRTNWATRRINQRDVGGKVLNFEEVSQQSSPYNLTVYIGNLVSGVTEDMIRNLFSSYGPIMEIRFFPEKGYSFVKYASHEQAAMAICGMNGSQVSGTSIKCSWGKEPSEAAILLQQQQYFHYYYNQYLNPSNPMVNMQYGLYQAGAAALPSAAAGAAAAGPPYGMLPMSPSYPAQGANGMTFPAAQAPAQQYSNAPGNGIVPTAAVAVARGMAHH